MAKDNSIKINTIKQEIKVKYNMDNLEQVEDFLRINSVNLYNNKFNVRQFSDIEREINIKLKTKNRKELNDEDLLCVKIGEFVAENNATVARVEKEFGINRKKYYEYKDRLKIIDEELYLKVQEVAQNNKKNNIIQKEVVKKKNDEIVLDDFDEKVKILKPAFEILVELIKSGNDYEFLASSCIKKMDTQKDGEAHRIENEYDENFDCCDTTYKQWEYQTKRRGFKDFENVIRAIRLLGFEDVKNINYQLKKYKDDTREYVSLDEKLRVLNDDINKTRMKLGIVEE